VLAAEASDRVLVVQRDEAMCREAADLLHPMKVTSTTSWEHGVELSQRIFFDVQVVDCCVRDGTLGRFCDGVRSLDPWVPIVVYTDERYAVAGRSVVRAGANVALGRPDDRDALWHSVRALQSVAARRAAEATLAERKALEDALMERFQHVTIRLEGLIEAGRVRAEAYAKFLEEREARTIAAKAFLSAGGTRADFERMWEPLTTELARYDDSTPAR
jgi:DNA-binding NtrC family response regulator